VGSARSISIQGLCRGGFPVVEVLWSMERDHCPHDLRPGRDDADSFCPLPHVHSGTSPGRITSEVCRLQAWPEAEPVVRCGGRFVLFDALALGHGNRMSFDGTNPASAGNGAVASLFHAGRPPRAVPDRHRSAIPRS
jgi:hypothetical protein